MYRISRGNSLIARVVSYSYSQFIHSISTKGRRITVKEMEMSTVIKNIHGSLSGQPIISQIMEHSQSLPCSFPQKSTTLRDERFSSYLRQDDPNQTDDTELSIFDAQKYFNEITNIDSKLSNRISPVNVINLERLSEPTDLPALPRFSSASSTDGFGRNHRARSFNATPTASSEASWNSRSGLLSIPPGVTAVSMRNPTTDHENRRQGSASKWLFGRKCPCSGKKSVQVEEKLSASEAQTPARLYHKKQTHKSVEIFREKSSAMSNWNERREVNIPNTHRVSTENRFPGLGQRILAAGSGIPYGYADGTAGFTFPILNNQTVPTMKLSSAKPRPSLEDPPRESLEIFQPSHEIINASRKSTDVRNRMFVSHQSFTFPASPSKTRMPITDDDVASDASSDLFEIESISTHPTVHPMYNRRDSLDEASSFNTKRLATATNGGGLMYSCRRSLDEPVTPSIAPTECYEPSEASIDWSVTTAEGFDRASFTNLSITASDHQIDDMPISMRQESWGGGGGGSGKKKGNGLLSCRCEKAVNVGPRPVKRAPAEGQTMDQPNTLRHVSSRTHNVNKRPVARS